MFMDTVNRKIATDLLIEVAMSTPGKQFIIFSPLSVSHVNKKIPNSADVRIHRMPKIARNQMTLD